MTVRTYIELFEPPIILTLTPTEGGFYRVTDQTGRLFFPPTSLDTAIRFMRAMEAKKQAVLDEDAIEYARADRVFGDYSVRVPDSNVVPIRRGA